MLIRLLPPSPMPTVLFSLSAPTLPNHLPIPPAYQASLQAVAEQALEQPTSLHSLDRASWPLALLDEVLFDLNTLTISVVWIDGFVQEWPICDSLHAMLRDVVFNVKKSEAEVERERLLLLTAPPSPPSPPTAVDDPASSNPALKERGKAKNKRQRSLIMNLVASVLSPAPSPSSQPPTLPLPPVSAPPPPVSTAPPPNHVPQSRLTRRKARSILLDAFRRFVVYELSSRTRAHQSDDRDPRPQPGRPSMGYVLWVAQSMLRRCRERMDIIAQEAQTDVPPLGSEAREDRDEDDCSDASNTSVVTPTSDTGLPLPLPPPFSSQNKDEALIMASLNHLADRLSLLVASLQHSAMLAQCQIDANMAALEERVKRRGKPVALDEFEPSTLGMFSAMGDDDEESDEDELYDDEDEDEYFEDEVEAGHFSLPYDASPAAHRMAQAQWSPSSNSHHQFSHQAPIHRRPYAVYTGSGTASQLARAVLLRRTFASQAHPYAAPVMEGDGTAEPFDSFPSTAVEPAPYAQATAESDHEVDFDLPVRFSGMHMQSEELDECDEQSVHPDDPFQTPYYPEDTAAVFEEHLPDHMYERCASPIPPDTMSIPSKRHGSPKSRSPLPSEFMAMGTEVA